MAPTLCTATRLENGRLRPAGEARSPSGAGLRHLAFHPSGRYAHVANELDSTASVLDLDSFEVGATLSTVADLGPDVASQPSAIRVAADGKFCYVANRGPDMIAVLVALDDGATTLRLIGNVPVGGQHPRDFLLAGDHLCVVNQVSETITTLRIDPASGVPEPTGAVLRTPPAPTCLVMR